MSRLSVAKACLTLSGDQAQARHPRPTAVHKASADRHLVTEVLSLVIQNDTSSDWGLFVELPP